MRIAMNAARVACEVAYVTYVNTSPGPPLATTLPATNVLTSSATLNGTIQAGNLTTTVTFEYGTTMEYGNTIAATPATVTGNTPTNVSANITGLDPLTTYHFRVKAVNNEGTAYGGDMSFTTTGACKDDFEPNNTVLSAVQIQPGLPLNALVNPSGDNDWFKFSNSSTQKNVKVELSNLPADYDLQLCNASGKVLRTSQNRGTTAETIIYNTTKTASFTTRVYGYNGAWSANDCYTLKVTLSSTKFAEKEGKNQGVAPEEGSVLVIYPNPASGQVNVDFSAEITGKGNISVYGLTGQRLISFAFNAVEGENTIMVNVGSLNKGIYFLELSLNGKKRFGKFIVE
jgi:hypothetical protein